MPVSQLTAAGQIIYGQPLTTVQLLDTAVARFNSAISVSTDAGITNFATVGKARALVDLGQFALAGTAAAAVPTAFAYVNEHSENTDRQNNGVFNGNFTDGRYAVADQEGGTGFPYMSVLDPRTTFFDGGAGFDGSTELWSQLRYGNRKASITVATGVEARLIQAEVALQAGDTLTGGQFLAQLNEPRANAGERGYVDPNPGSAGAGTAPIGVLPDLTAADIASAGGAVNLLFAERARWLWFTAHRLGDLRRLIRQYGRAANAVFPTGPYFKVNFTDYGNDVNFPVPVSEKNNPNFTACLDRNP